MRLNLEIFPLIISKKNIIHINKLISNEFKELKIDKLIKEYEKSSDIEELFWLVLCVTSTGREIPAQNWIKKIVFEHRSGEGGFYATDPKFPDINTTFKCLAILHFINAELNIDENKMVLRFIDSVITKSGLAKHCFNKKCKCRSKTSTEYTFYAISSLILLDSLMEIDEEKLKSLTSSKILFSENQLVFRLLINQFLYSRQKIDKIRLNKKLQRNIDFLSKDLLRNPKNADELIYLIYFLKSNNLLGNFNVGLLYQQYIKNILENYLINLENKSRESNISFYKIIILLCLIYEFLLEEFEIRIFKEFSKGFFIRLEPISSQYNVSIDLITSILGLIETKYKWFNTKKVKYEELFNKFLNNFKEPEKSVIINLKKAIIDENNYKIYYSIQSKDLNISIDKLKEIFSVLIDYGLIFGKIETKYLKILTIPDYFYILKKKIPLKEILQEKEELELLNLNIIEIIKEIQTYPQKFSNSVEYLLNIDEFDLAETKVSKNIKNYFLLIDNRNEMVQSKTKNLKYFSTDYLDYYPALLNTVIKIKSVLEETEKLLLKEIKKQKAIFTAYSEIANFIDSFTDEQAKLKKGIDELFIKFFKASKDKNIEKEKKSLMNKLEEVENSLKSLMSKLEENKKHFINLTSKIKLFNNFMIIEDKKFDYDHELSPELKSGNPFDWWIKNYWDVKRSDLHKKINVFQSYFFKREQIIEYLDEKKLEFRDIYENLSNLSNSEKCLDLLIETDDKLLKIDKFIKDFISDTSKVLDNFPDVILDVRDDWNTFKNEFIILLQPIKEKIEVQILSTKKIKIKLDIEKRIDSKIRDFEKSLGDLDKLAKKNWLKSKTPLINEFNETIKQQFDEYREFDQELSKLYARYESEFKKTEQFLSIAINKWKDFFTSIEDVYKEKRSKLIKNVLYSLISNQDFMKGGRIKLKYLSQKLGLDISTIKSILERSMELFSVDVIFTEKDEIIPLFQNNKKLWEFENFLISSSQEFQSINDEMIKAFRKMIDKKAIKLNEDELRKRISVYKERLLKVEKQFETQGKTYLKMGHLKKLLIDWEESHKIFKESLKNIEYILVEREEIESYFNEFFLNIENKFEKLKNLKELNQRKEILSMYDEIDFLINTLDFEKTSPANAELLKPKIPAFGNYLTDLQKEVDKKFKDMKEVIKAFQYTSNKKYQELLEGICLVDVNQRIGEYKQDFKDLLSKIDAEIQQLKIKQEPKLYKKEIKKYRKELENYLDEVMKELMKFIVFIEEERGLKYFRYDSKFILQDWNIDEINEGIDIYFSTY